MKANEKKVAVGLGIAAAVGTGLYFALKDREPVGACKTTDAPKCFNNDLYECVDGEWMMTQANAPECIQPDVGEFYCSQITVEPSVVVVGNPVEIRAKIVSETQFGIFSIACYINGDTMADDCTFTPDKVWCYAHFAYTPTVAKEFTAEVLDRVATFEAVEEEVGTFCDPYTENACYPTKIALVENIEVPYWGDGIWKIACPYCDWEFKSYGTYENPNTLPAAWDLIEHIHTEHELIDYPFGNYDMTFMTTAVRRADAWGIFMRYQYGKVPPTVIILGESSDISDKARASASEWIREANATLYVSGGVKPAYYTFDGVFGVPEDAPIVSSVEAEIPELEGKFWTAKLGGWNEGNMYYNEAPRFDIFSTISGNGSLIRFEDVATTGDYFPNYLTLIISYDSETLVVGNAYGLVKSPIQRLLNELEGLERDYSEKLAELSSAKSIVSNWISNDFPSFGDDLDYSFMDLEYYGSRDPITIRYTSGSRTGGIFRREDAIEINITPTISGVADRHGTLVAEETAVYTVERDRIIEELARYGIIVS